MEETGAGHLVERAAARMRAVAGEPSLTRLMQTSEALSGPARQADKAPHANDQAVSRASCQRDYGHALLR